MTDIKLGTVINNKDLLELGHIIVSVPDIDPIDGIKVEYTSPYLVGGKAGFLAIPEVGVPILICKPDGQSKWFYLSTVVDSLARYAGSNNPKQEISNGDWLPEGHKTYYYAGFPQQLLLKSPKGHALRLCEQGNEESTQIKVELESSLGKRLTLHDSPEVNSVILEDGEGNFIKFYTNEGQIFVTASRSLVLTSKNSNLDIINENGREINIKNHSTGSQRSSENDSSPGNINIETDFGDLNITTNSKDGSIFVTCKGSNSHVVVQAENITLNAV